ncbi:hypothetical protein EVAR_56247_1 [Eumeta japonica]|uniref:Uncharacterized protein n=1 Tax=Eumeta variegata TaxID=151549 RepID=A0A4C1XK93_EUMVA|nr:hypothetical protein EVAR_56247_1 [Eumeta japonica]
MRAALIRSASTSVRPPAVGCVYGLFRASLPPSDTTSSQPPHPTLSACAVTRAAGGPACTGSTPRQGLERRARSVRSTPTRVTDACRLDPVGVHSVRPPAVGCVSSRLCLPPLVEHQPTPEPPSTCRRLRNDRARPRVGRRLGSGKMSINGSKTDHCHLSRRGRIPDEKTPGHEATIRRGRIPDEKTPGLEAKNKSSVPYLHP